VPRACLASVAASPGTFPSAAVAAASAAAVACHCRGHARQACNGAAAVIAAEATEAHAVAHVVSAVESPAYLDSPASQMHLLGPLCFAEKRAGHAAARAAPTACSAQVRTGSLVHGSARGSHCYMTATKQRSRQAGDTEGSLLERSVEATLVEAVASHPWQPAAALTLEAGVADGSASHGSRPSSVIAPWQGCLPLSHPHAPLVSSKRK